MLEPGSVIKITVCLSCNTQDGGDSKVQSFENYSNIGFYGSLTTAR